MCWGIYLGLPGSKRASVETSDAEDTFAIWPVSNAWMQLALGHDYSCWMLGDARHCSCGRVRKESKDAEVVEIDFRAASLIAKAADGAGHVVFLVHYASGNFNDEEIAFEIGTGRSSEQLRTARSGKIPVDSYVWVAGRR